MKHKIKNTKLNNEVFIWDKYSDQPYSIKNKEYKKSKRKENSFDYLPLFFTNLFVFPLGLLFSFFCPSFSKSKKKKFDNFFAMCVNLDKGEEQIKLINELGLEDIQIRVPLAELSRLDEYFNFAKKFKNKKILINILQTRDFIEDKDALKLALEQIFEKFGMLTDLFQIGNVSNRTKWGFFSIKEYLEFYKVAYDLRNEKFHDILLLGSSTIDFEYHYTIRALFNAYKIKYDINASLLYVDRRGQPENTQMGIFNLSKKINFLYALCFLSPKSSKKIFITEANWPLKNTAPFAPTSEKECVSEDTYTNYMLRYFFLAMSSQKIQKVYWHQLIANGYGLVDSRDGLRKRPAYYAFKFMLKILKNASFEKLKISKHIYKMSLKNENEKIDILWTSLDNSFSLNKFSKVYDKMGNILENNIKISQNPIYIIHKEKK